MHVLQYKKVLHVPEGVCSLPLQAPVGSPSGRTLHTDLTNFIGLTEGGQMARPHDCNTSWGERKEDMYM